MNGFKKAIYKPMLRRIGHTAAGYLAGMYSVITPDTQQATIAAVIAVGGVVYDLFLSAQARR